MKSFENVATTPDSIRQFARMCLVERGLDRKVELTRQAVDAWRDGQLKLEPLDHGPVTPGEIEARKSVVPGLPPGLVLTSPTKVRRRGFGSAHGKAAFVHAIAHIEWNAINLAWDAVWRFDAMPREYYDDWSRVAAEEAEHFAMLRGRLL